MNQCSEGECMFQLKTKQHYIRLLESLKKIAVDIGFSIEKIEKLGQTLSNYELLIPVVGEFSAGKSSFLNSFIGRNVLSVSINPETAVATELRYSTEDYAEVLIENGESIVCKRISIEETANVKKDWRCIRLYLNSENLKSIEPLVMVDMPGFDSPRDDHNRAITSYLNRGVHYIVLTSVESGTVTASMKRQIQDIQNMGRTSSFFVSKANLRGEDDVNAVCDEVQSQVEDILEESVEVKPLYKDAGAELKKLIDSIDPEQLFGKVFKDGLIQLIDELESSVMAKMVALKSDQEKNKHAIRDMEEALDKLLRKRDRMIADAKNNHFEDDVDAIIAAAANAINVEIDRLINMAMHGTSGEAISQEMSSIVRSAVIPAVNRVAKGITEKISTNFQMELQSYQKTFSLFDNPELISKVGTATSQFGDMAKIAFNGASSLVQKGAAKAGLNAAYKTVAGVIGIASNVFAPVVEIALLFLPEILGFIFGSMSKKQQECDQRESIRSQILNAIPKMKHDLRAQIEPALQKQSEAAIEAVSEEFNERVKELVDNIQKANDELENNVDVIEKMQKLEKAKIELNQIKNNL